MFLAFGEILLSILANLTKVYFKIYFKTRPFEACGLVYSGYLELERDSQPISFSFGTLNNIFGLVVREEGVSYKISVLMCLNLALRL